VASSQDADTRKSFGQGEGYYNARQGLSTRSSAVIKAGQYAYRDRRRKKRDFRASGDPHQLRRRRGFDLSYSRLMAGLKAAASKSIGKSAATSRSSDIEAFGKIAEKATASRDLIASSAALPRIDRTVDGRGAQAARPLFARGLSRRGLSPVDDE